MAAMGSLRAMAVEGCLLICTFPIALNIFLWQFALVDVYKEALVRIRR
jgi:hypothetical protein